MTLSTLKLQDTSRLHMMDVSFLSRFGIKGGGASNWLKAHGILVPEHSNTWRALPQGALIARLGIAEFLIEDSSCSHYVSKLMLACHPLPVRVHPFLRQDLAIALSGEAVHDFLWQICDIDCQSLDLSEHPVVRTTMIGADATVIPSEFDGKLACQIWCDGRIGTYIWKTLGAIAQDFGGSLKDVTKLYENASAN
jgi:sarcosine oxidase, subunit gamma